MEEILETLALFDKCQAQETTTTPNNDPDCEDEVPAESEQPSQVNSGNVDQRELEQRLREEISLEIRANLESEYASKSR